MEENNLNIIRNKLQRALGKFSKSPSVIHIHKQLESINHKADVIKD
jgi:hypothetical protein